MRRYAFLSLLLCACGTDAAPAPDAGPHACDQPWQLVLFNRDELRSTCHDSQGNLCDVDGIALPKGAATTVAIAAVDKDKQVCDPSQLTAQLVGDEAGDFQLSSDADGNLVITPTLDLFDNGGIEPAAALEVDYGPLTEYWELNAVVDLTGSWEITVDGLTVGDFDAAQTGRTVRWADCAPDDPNPECSSGYLYGWYVWLASPIGGLTLEGKIAPTRDRLDGTWTNGTDSGVWYAVKKSGT